MAKAAKTTASDADVAAFLDRVASAERRADCASLCTLMQALTGEPPVLWGTSIVGFGSYHYVYASGRSGDAPLIGFSPRKGDLTIYVIPGFDEYADDLAMLGPHKTGKSCLYVKRLADLDQAVLKRICRRSVSAMRKKYRTST